MRAWTGGLESSLFTPHSFPSNQVLRVLTLLRLKTNPILETLLNGIRTLQRINRLPKRTQSEDLLIVMTGELREKPNPMGIFHGFDACEFVTKRSQS